MKDTTTVEQRILNALVRIGNTLDERLPKEPARTQRTDDSERGDEDAKAMHATTDTHLDWDDLSNVEKDAIRSQAVRMAQHFDAEDHLAAVRKARDERDDAIARAESWRDANSGILAERDAALDEVVAWRAKHAALREDVDGLRRNPKSLTDVLMRVADALDHDDARDPQADPDTVTLRRDDDLEVEIDSRINGPTRCTVKRHGVAVFRGVSLDALSPNVRAALEWGWL